LFDRNGSADRKHSALRHLETALEHWQRYAAIATSQYRPPRLTRIGYVDLKLQIRVAPNDLRRSSSPQFIVAFLRLNAQLFPPSIVSNNG